ncbi:hypothetical protein FUAX_42460 (plasmid) [Fulvitalea axinellae]|uniref:RNA polymerase sigma-70 factor n=1 Tax=Fulvitalea axinellae TaxID=1182444 RepID=A0AAU9CZ77_9BACT|nr:hypothetical protein FUAX_42460 [Fulvitalea axinellae]
MKSVSEQIQAIVQGDEKAFEQLVEMLYPTLFFFVKEFVKNAEDAEEVTQDTFLKLWEKKKTLDQQSNPRAYIFTIAKNYALIKLRNKKRRLKDHQFQEIDFEIKILESYNPETILLAEETRDIINDFIRNLPEQRKKVFTLCRKFGFTNKEAAVNLGLSLKTIETHMRLVHRDLKEFLTKEVY